MDQPWYKANVHGKNDHEVFSAIFPNASPEELKQLSLRKDAWFRTKVACSSRPHLASRSHVTSHLTARLTFLTSPYLTSLLTHISFLTHFRAQAKSVGMKYVDGLPEALAFAKREGVRCIAVSNAPRAACECALEMLRETVDAAGSDVRTTDFSTNRTILHTHQHKPSIARHTPQRNPLFTSHCECEHVRERAS